MKSKASLLTRFFSLALGCELEEAGEACGPIDRASKGLEVPRCHVLVNQQ